MHRDGVLAIGTHPSVTAACTPHPCPLPAKGEGDLTASPYATCTITHAYPALSTRARIPHQPRGGREARRTLVGRLPGGGGESSRTAGPGARSCKGKANRPPPDARDNARKPGSRRRMSSHLSNTRGGIRLRPVTFFDIPGRREPGLCISVGWDYPHPPASPVPPPHKGEGNGEASAPSVGTPSPLMGREDHAKHGGWGDGEPQKNKDPSRFRERPKIAVLVAQ